MGNCIAHENMSLDDDNHNGDQHLPSTTTEAAEAHQRLPRQESTESVGPAMKGDKRKTVRFKLGEEDHERGDCISSGSHKAVRIRLVVTAKELQEILSYEKGSSCKYASVEQLLSSLTLDRTKITVADPSRCNPGINIRWIPALESIPEDPHLSSCHT